MPTKMKATQTSKVVTAGHLSGMFALYDIDQFFQTIEEDHILDRLTRLSGDIVIFLSNFVGVARMILAGSKGTWTDQSANGTFLDLETFLDNGFSNEYWFKDLGSIDRIGFYGGASENELLEKKFSYTPEKDLQDWIVADPGVNNVKLLIYWGGLNTPGTFYWNGLINFRYSQRRKNAKDLFKN